MAAPQPGRNGVRTMLGYNETLMYGVYTRYLAKVASREADEIQARRLHKKAEEIHVLRGGDSPDEYQDECSRWKFGWIWTRFVGNVAEDWIFLTLLGIVMALLSFAMDYMIERCLKARIWMFESLSFSVVAQYFSWILAPIVLVCFSTGFTHLVEPHAIGSGIPEIKTIMRGVVLKEYLTFRTLVAKVIGLSTALGSGIPIGKEGPFVHVASISATVLAKLFPSFRKDSEQEAKKTEILAAACAVGVACTFAAPIGGVLFSIEVTAAYFCVRNYWRGFYSAICGAIMFRLLSILVHDEATLTALFKTNLRQDVPFDPVEMLSFAVVGVVCGFGGALFIYVHKNIVLFVRGQKKLTTFLQKNRFIYPSTITFVVMSLLFPPGLGQYMAGILPNPGAVDEMFGNTTWSTRDADTYEEDRMLKVWRGPLNNVFLTLSLFIFFRFFMCAIATTLPVPSGIFIPSFTLGAAIGRLIGEALAVWFPEGIFGELVVPGGYAIVGAAAFSGSVTHTVSTAVIVFELTGQIGHVLPCVIAVFIANVISKLFTVSFYDMIVEIKKLPYLHSTLPATNNAHHVLAEDFMEPNVDFVALDMTYREMNKLLNKLHRAYPIVDTKENMMLLGSVHRIELEHILSEQFTEENMELYFKRKMDEAEKSAILDNSQQSQETPTKPKFTITKLDSQVALNEYYKLEPTATDLANISYRETESDNNNQLLPAKVTDNHKPIKKSESLHHVHFAVSFDSHDPDEEKEWEDYQLDRRVCMEECQINPAPYQVVEKTSLYRVHSLFTLLSLHHAFVTSAGRLVGIISLEEVRNAIQSEINISALRKTLQLRSRDKSKLHQNGVVKHSKDKKSKKTTKQTESSKN